MPPIRVQAEKSYHFHREFDCVHQNYLADNVSLDVVEGIARLKDELKPELIRVVFKDAGFGDDVVKTNTVQILRQHGIEDVKSI